ncbi:MAG TPA: DNA gyrase subunit A [Candidatus Bathyarchaeia archaeon]|nr:DNA gyrase subunit A [Candidatus Bathyarchaeia archaeon]
MSHTTGDRVKPVAIETEMRRSYIKYAMSVIIGRAVPDVRDGLKPVQRRILYAIQGLGLGSKNQHKKSARVVGEIIGKFHPHGEMAVYDALVRMAQDFSMRYPLINGQGNFGSIDGDSPAAVRYTETRLTKLAEDMLEELEKNAVDWMPNFDDSLQEPTVLPAKFPNLLVNGGSGIAVGMSSSIPPHNLREVMDALIFLTDHPSTKIEDLLKFVRGPDFPTGGIVYDATSLLQTYKQGRGTIKILARIEEEITKGDKKRLVITEFPFQVNKSKIVGDIANLVKEGEIEGISNIRDESSREGIRVTIDLKSGAQPDFVKGQLYKLTQLHTSFSFINLVLVNGRPQILDLKQALQAFIDHRINVIERRSKHDLQQAQERLNILEGYHIALGNIDKVISIIRNSQNPEEASKTLKELQLNDEQIDAILEMKLQQLTKLETNKVRGESDEKRSLILELQEVLSERSKLLTLLKTEFTKIKQDYGDARKTEIRLESVNFDVERVIKDEPTLILLTTEGYVKRVGAKSFQVLERGAAGIPSIDLKELDKVSRAVFARTLQTILFLTNQGRAYTLKAHEIPESTRSGRGMPIVNLLQLSDDERLVASVPVETFTTTQYLTLVTRHGNVKRTPLDAFSNVRSTGIIAAQFDEKDSLAEALVTTGNGQILITTADGLIIRFEESDISIMGRTAKGVTGIKLEEGSEVIGACFIPNSPNDVSIFSITRRGYGKRISAKEIRVQKRGGSGIVGLKANSKSGNLVGILPLTEQQDVIVISEKGEAVRLNATSVPLQRRTTAGSRLTKLEEGDGIASLAAIQIETERKETNEKKARIQKK